MMAMGGRGAHYFPGLSTQSPETVDHPSDGFPVLDNLSSSNKSYVIL